MPDLEHNKQDVMAFYDLMFNQCRPREAIERYAGEQYIQPIQVLLTARKGSSPISRKPLAITPASVWNSNEWSPRATTWSFIVASIGPVIMYGPASTSSGSMIRARSWNTGTCCKSCPIRLQIPTECSESARSLRGFSSRPRIQTGRLPSDSR